MAELWVRSGKHGDSTYEMTLLRRGTERARGLQLRKVTAEGVMAETHQATKYTEM